MVTRKECPLCGELMAVKERQTSTQIPGNPHPTTFTVREWVCRDCEYFEEAGENDEG
jgi:C4-type Zn-finger protein